GGARPRRGAAGRRRQGGGGPAGPAHRGGDPGDGAGPLAARRRAHRGGPAARHPLRLQGAGPGAGRAVEPHGGAAGRADRPGVAGRVAQGAAGGPAGGHGPLRQVPGDQLRERGPERGRHRGVTTLVGRQIGRYRILEELGSGGMSVVYKGLDTALDREVAVKVLHPHLSGKDESRRRLAREAKAVAKLHHPNILEVFDFSTAESEDAFIVTEYIRGQTLRAFAERERFEPPEVAAMAIHEIAAALAHAHESGVIHRDLKPENVMVREDGVLKLMDFGIAKIVDRDDKMTVTGSLVGSPAHMAPEIIEGLEAGAEADVFSLGTMLYLLAVGQLPFTAPNTTATLKRILDCEYDDPRQVNPAVSDELAEIVSRCLTRAPSGRYPNAAKLRDALAAYLEGVGLSRPHEELQRFFAGPAAYRKALVPALVERRLARADTFVAEGRPAKALACLNHVLALDPANAKAQGLLEVMNQARRRQQKKATAKRTAVSGGAAAAALGLIAVALATRPVPPPVPVDDRPTPFAEVPAPPRAEIPVLGASETRAKHPVVSAARSTLASAGAGKVSVSVQVRPWAYVQVDD